MNRKPLVTVLMGSYNPRWDRLRRAVESLWRQTLEDWELVLWDDGSCPRGAMALEQAACLDSRVRLYRGRENRGLGYALNAQRAQGRYLARLDDDDVCHPRRLERQVSFLESHPQYGWVGSAAWRVDSHGLWGRLDVPELPAPRDFAAHSPYIHPAVLFRREVLGQGYSQSPRYLGCEDYQLFLRLHRQGWQLAIHGNGDDAIQMILNAYEEAQKRYPRADARHIVIHCQTVREDQLDRIKRLGVVPSFFVVHTYFWGDRHRDIFLGPDRAKRISPLRSALKRGILFSNHNDTFVTPIDPLLSVWSAVNRITSSGQVLGEEYTISVMDALRSVTSWAAYQACEERIKGSLEPGKLADMVVLGDNPLAVDKKAIRDIPVLATIVGNELVYGSLE